MGGILSLPYEVQHKVRTMDLLKKKKSQIPFLLQRDKPEHINTGNSKFNSQPLLTQGFFITALAEHQRDKLCMREERP